MKVQIKRAFLLKAIFCYQKKKKDRLCMKFSSTPNKSVQRCLYPLFQINAPIFSCPLFFEEYLNPLVKISNMVNEHTVDYHPSSLGLTSRIRPLIFLWTLRGLSLFRMIFKFFLKPV